MIIFSREENESLLQAQRHLAKMKLNTFYGPISSYREELDTIEKAFHTIETARMLAVQAEAVKRFKQSKLLFRGR